MTQNTTPDTFIPGDLTMQDVEAMGRAVGAIAFAFMEVTGAEPPTDEQFTAILDRAFPHMDSTWEAGHAAGMNYESYLNGN